MKHGSSKALLRGGSDALADVEPGKGPVDVLVVDVELSGMLKKERNVGGGRVVEDIDDGVGVETHHGAEQLH